MTTDRPLLANTLLLSLVFAFFGTGPVALSESDSPSPLDRNGTRLFAMAKTYLEKSNPEAAKNLLETMLQLNPKDAEAYLYLGKAYALEKDFPKARSQFSYCLRMADELDIARQANEQLLKLPKRFLRPKSLGSLAPSERDPSADKQSLLVFFASWDSDSIKLKDIAESTRAKSPNLTIKTFDVSDPGSRAVFDLYNVSAIPTVLVLSKGRQQVITSMVGSIPEQSLRNLILFHSRLI
jgi:tetratricopeptide (TPR) repeat protein